MLMACGDEALFITVMGFYLKTFCLFHERFHMLYREYTMMGKWDREIQRFEGEKGMRRSLTPEGCLGLVFEWTRTRGSL
eukprot:7324965-Ditylum_brightwellii.AAC.1